MHSSPDSLTYEHNGRRVNRAIAVNLCNTLMCVTTSIVIVAYRA